MNCRPGDLAVILGKGVFAGRLVEVLYAAPQVEFQLPDGYSHMGNKTVGCFTPLGRRLMLQLRKRGSCDPRCTALALTQDCAPCVVTPKNLTLGIPWQLLPSP